LAWNIGTTGRMVVSGSSASTESEHIIAAMDAEAWSDG
jgi:hypothetical protein